MKSNNISISKTEFSRLLTQSMMLEHITHLILNGHGDSEEIKFLSKSLNKDANEALRIASKKLKYIYK